MWQVEVSLFHHRGGIVGTSQLLLLVLLLRKTRVNQLLASHAVRQSRPLRNV